MQKVEILSCPKAINHTECCKIYVCPQELLRQCLLAEKITSNIKGDISLILQLSQMKKVVVYFTRCHNPICKGQSKVGLHWVLARF